MSVLPASPGRPTRSNHGLGLRQPVVEDRDHRDRGEGGVRGRPARIQEAGPERPAAHDPRLGRSDERERGDPAEQPEPDREDLPVGPPGVAAVLGHPDERDRGVGGEPGDERPPPGASRHDELEPDDRGEAGDGRPATQARRVRRRRPAAEPQPTQERGTGVVQGAERVEPRPGGSDERRHEGEADPPVRPQEQARDVGLARPAHEALGEEPGDRHQAEDPEGRTQEARNGAHAVLGRSEGRDVAQEDDGEREGDGRGRPGEVDGQRDRRLERARQLVAKGGSGEGEQDGSCRPGRTEQARDRDGDGRGHGDGPAHGASTMRCTTFRPSTTR